MIVMRRRKRREASAREVESPPSPGADRPKRPVSCTAVELPVGAADMDLLLLCCLTMWTTCSRCNKAWTTAPVKATVSEFPLGGRPVRDVRCGHGARADQRDGLRRRARQGDGAARPDRRRERGDAGAAGRADGRAAQHRLPPARQPPAARARRAGPAPRDLRARPEALPARPQRRLALRRAPGRAAGDGAHPRRAGGEELPVRAPRLQRRLHRAHRRHACDPARAQPGRLAAAPRRRRLPRAAGLRARGVLAGLPRAPRARGAHAADAGHAGGAHRRVAHDPSARLFRLGRGRHAGRGGGRRPDLRSHAPRPRVALGRRDARALLRQPRARHSAGVPRRRRDLPGARLRRGARRLTGPRAYALTGICVDGYSALVPSPWSALADPRRRAMLELMLERPRAVNELVEGLGLSQPGTSKHLRVLREAGLVQVRQEAQRRVYAVEPGPLAELDVWLAPYRRLWNDSLDALERHLDDAREAAT